MRKKGNNLHLELKNVKPITDNQKEVFENYQKNNLILLGSAGTGKSYLSLYLSLFDILESNKHNKLIIIRSAVPSKDLGFLPGDEKEKTMVYELPYDNICNELCNRGDAYSILTQKGIIEFMSTSYLRGLTWDNCIIFVDEIQNMMPSELNTIMTRLGKNTKIIFAGDGDQSDMLARDKSGFAKFVDVITKMDEFKTTKFTTADIVRSGIVRNYLILKEKLGVEF